MSERQPFEWISGQFEFRQVDQRAPIRETIALKEIITQIQTPQSIQGSKALYRNVREIVGGEVKGAAQK